MKNHSYVPLPGSFRAVSDFRLDGKPDPKELVEISVRVRPKTKLPDEATIQSAKHPLTHEEYDTRYGAAENDVRLITNFAREAGLSVSNVSSARRTIQLAGTVDRFEQAFGVELYHFKASKGEVFRGRSGNIHVPLALSTVIEGVFGLDNRPAARPMFQFAKKKGIIVSHAANPNAFTGDQLAAIYNFPKGYSGKGETIAIIELGGGYQTKDIVDYFTSLNISPPSVSMISVDNATNSPSDPNGADAEVMLDIEVAGAVSPDAKIVVYFAPNTDQGFLDCITTAIHDSVNNPSVISLSWGSPESTFTAQAIANFTQAFQAAATLGITVCVAAGDQGSSDGLTDGQVHVDFPASSQYVLACGGTRLSLTSGKISSETVWHESDTSATGGGVSELFALPAYQSGAGVPVSLNTQFKGRGLPDVAANADPATGYKVLVDGQQAIIGGTSAVAPLMAGLIARINEKQGSRAGFIHPVLYASPGLCRDITEGDNKTTAAGLGYSAAPGWDACTGWGVLSGLDKAVAPLPAPAGNTASDQVAAIQSNFDQSDPLS